MINFQYRKGVLYVNLTRLIKTGDRIAIASSTGGTIIRKVKSTENWNGFAWSKTKKRVYYPLWFYIDFKKIFNI